MNATPGYFAAKGLIRSSVGPHWALVQNLGVAKITLHEGSRLRFGEGNWDYDEAHVSPVHVCLVVFTPDGNRILSAESADKDEHLVLTGLKPGQYRFWAEASRGYFPLQGYVTVSRFHGARDVCLARRGSPGESFASVSGNADVLARVLAKSGASTTAQFAIADHRSGKAAG